MEIIYKPDAVVIKPSVVGVIILAISFAFFIAFVICVYTLRDIGGMPTAAPAPQLSTGTLERSSGG